MATAAKERRMERKTIRISSKRQVTIPQRYFECLGFGEEAECILRGNELVIRPVKAQSGGEFSEQIPRDAAESSCWNDLRQSRKKCAPLWSA